MMRSLLGMLRLPHYLALGAVVAVLAGGLPSNWFGLAGKQVSEVERLSSCLQRHHVELTALVTTLGDPSSVLSDSSAARARAVHVAERERRLHRRQGEAIEACARTVTG